MGQSLIVLLRGFVLLAFLVVMPLLAAPAVGKWYDAWLLGDLSLAESPVLSPTGALEISSGETEEAPVLAKRPPAADGTLPLDRHENTNLATPPFASSPAAAAENSGERFEAIPKRLQQLGAEYLRLESVEGDEPRYRFCCTVPLPGSEAYRRQFEVTAADPVEAMQLVLAQVEAWQAERKRPPENPAAVHRR